MPRSRSLTDRGPRLAASASSSWVSRASARSCRSSPANESACCSATTPTPLIAPARGHRPGAGTTLSTQYAGPATPRHPSHQASRAQPPPLRPARSGPAPYGGRDRDRAQRFAWAVAWAIARGEHAAGRDGGISRHTTRHLQWPPVPGSQPDSPATPLEETTMYPALHYQLMQARAAD